MEINNFKDFRKLLDFSKKNSFYFLQIIKRSKDAKVISSSNNRYRRIKSFYIASLEEYDKYQEEIITLCKDNNARAYIRISPISFFDVALNTAIEYMRRIRECQTFKSQNIFDSCCETTRTNGEKVWMIDCDNTEFRIDTLKELGIEIIDILPTVNGMHYIIKPFDRRKWTEELTREIGEIKNINPITLIYYCDNS